MEEQQQEQEKTAADEEPAANGDERSLKITHEQVFKIFSTWAAPICFDPDPDELVRCGGFGSGNGPF